MNDAGQQQANARAPRKRGGSAAPRINAGLRVADRIKLRLVRDIKLNPRNTRKHSAEQVGSIVASIRKFGFTMPLLLDGEDMLIAGEGRLLAAQQLGMTRVPTIDGSYMTEDERRAYVIADNQIALGSEWDTELLQQEIGALDMMGFDLDVLGFSTAELDAMRVDAGPGPEEEGQQRRGGKGGNSDRAESPVVQYTIVFDNDAQQQAWFGLVRGLRQRYPDKSTIGERLAAWIEETNG